MPHSVCAEKRVGRGALATRLSASAWILFAALCGSCVLPHLDTTDAAGGAGAIRGQGGITGASAGHSSIGGDAHASGGFDNSQGGVSGVFGSGGSTEPSSDGSGAAGAGGKGEDDTCTLGGTALPCALR